MPQVYVLAAVDAEVKRLADIAGVDHSAITVFDEVREHWRKLARHTLAVMEHKAEVEASAADADNRAAKAEAEVARLSTLLNTPHLHQFAEAVVMEALHQRERWGVRHDAGKTDADWHWLIGSLSSKALHNPPNKMPPLDAKLHRIIAAAAACANWHAAVAGDHTAMRPGIAPPDGEGMER